MKYGVSIPLLIDRDDSEPCRETYALCQTAEAAGFDFLTMGHHVFTPDYPTSAPFVVLAGIAARTSRIELASVIYLLPLYHPVAVAEQVAMLDVISGGRVIFGCGVGYREYEFAGFGVDFHRRGARANEALAAIRSAWETGRFNHHGSEFDIPDLPSVPLPVRKPHPPIWVGGESRGALRRAAKYGDGWVSANVQPMEELLDLVSTYRALCHEAARQPFVCLSRDAWVVESKDELLAEWYPEMAKRHAHLKSVGLAVPSAASAETTLDSFIQDRAIAGTPADCVGQIGKWREQSGCHALLLLLNKKASFERLQSAIKLFGEKVLPAARSAALA